MLTMPNAEHSMLESCFLVFESTNHCVKLVTRLARMVLWFAGLHETNGERFDSQMKMIFQSGTGKNCRYLLLHQNRLKDKIQ